MELPQRDAVLWSGPATLFDAGSRRVGELSLTSDELFFICLGSGDTASTPTAIPWILLLGPIGLLIVRAQARQKREAVNEAIREIEDTPGAMSLDARYACSPGSIRVPYAQIASASKTWLGRLRITTALGGRHELSVSDVGLVTVKVARLMEAARPPAPGLGDGEGG